MKIRNKNTNHVFNLPKEDVEQLIAENPFLYEKVVRTLKNTKEKNVQNIKPLFEQNTILPLIWEK